MGLDIPQRSRLLNFLLLKAEKTSLVTADQMVDHDTAENKKISK
jgi:hypothetical protein